MDKDARYFKHDSNARHDPKIKSLVNKFGIVSYAWFWIVIEILRESSGYKLEDKSFVWETLAQETRSTVEEMKLFIEGCVERDLFAREDDGSFYSWSLIKRMTTLNELRQKRSEAGKKGAEAKWGDRDI